MKNNFILRTDRDLMGGTGFSPPPPMPITCGLSGSRFQFLILILIPFL